MNFIPETIIRALCWTLLHSLWQGLILAVVAGAVMLLTKRARSATRYSMLAVLLMAFLAVSGYTFFRELRVPVAVRSAVVAHDPESVGNGGQVVLTPGAPVQAKGIEEQLVQYFNTHASVVVVVWFIVFLARFVKLLSGLVYTQRIRHYGNYAAPAEWTERLAELLRRLKITRPVRLLESTLIKVPAVVGWVKPVILVPVGMLTQLSPDQVESILLHELAHISRRDYLFNFIQHIVDTLFFFNPALLWVSSLIRTERENCCDDVAIRETRSRRKLIEALVSFHEYQQVVRGYALGFAGQNDQMVKRVERIVHKRNHSLNAGERLLLMGGLLILCGAFITINTGKAKAAVVVVTAPKAVVPASTAAKPAVKKPLVMTVNASVMAITASPKVNLKKPAPPAAIPAPPKDTTKPTPEPNDSTDVDKLIQAHDHGVTPEFVAALRKLGYSVNLDLAIRLVDHGVTVEFVKSLKEEGYGAVPLKKTIALMDHGVTVEFIRDVRAQGFPDLTLEDAVTLVDHGVTADFIAGWKKKTGTKLALNDYIRLRDAGIDPS